MYHIPWNAIDFLYWNLFPIIRAKHLLFALEMRTGNTHNDQNND
jgi:hypothetical protein